MTTGIAEVKASLKNAQKAPTAETTYVPMFVPMGRQPGKEKMKCRGKWKDVHTTDVITRGQLLADNLDASLRSGNFGAVYKAYVLAVASFLLTLLTLPLSVYVSGAFAFMTGYFYSERLLNSAWGIAWYKGKSITYTN